MSRANPYLDLLIQYWLRAIRIGVQATALVLVALALLLVLPGDGRVRPVPFAIILAMAGAGGLVVSLLPWPHLFESAWGLRCLYAWSVTDIVLISLGVAASGGARSELFIAYALTTVFFGACYPRPAHPILLAFTFTCYLAVLWVTGWDISPAALVLRLMMLGILALITSFLSGELLRRAHANHEARANAERWAALLSSVASAGRSMTLDPKRVVEVAVDSALSLGFEGAGLCVLDEEARSWRLVHAQGLPESYVRTHATAHAATDGIVGLVLRSGATCTVARDSPGSESFPSSEISSPPSWRARSGSLAGSPVCWSRPVTTRKCRRRSWRRSNCLPPRRDWHSRTPVATSRSDATSSAWRSWTA